MSETVKIEVRNYCKTYGTTVAVTDLSFTVCSGQVLGVVGPNGAGKTTTFRAISGIIPPTSGELMVSGFNVVSNPVQAKQVLAYIPDDPRLFDSLTVWEHLEFVASTYRVRDHLSTAAQLLSRFELTEKRNTIAQELSRGMRQKVAICCAYLHAPDVILFDEPLTGLDPRAIRTLKESILERAQEGAAVLISSHLLSLVEDLCTDILILDHGRRRFFGSLAELKSEFKSLEGEQTLEEIFFHATEGTLEREDV